MGKLGRKMPSSLRNFKNLTRSKGFVKMSDTCSSVLEWDNGICFAATVSRTKWYRMSMCLFRSLIDWFWADLIELELSIRSEVGVGPFAPIISQRRLLEILRCTVWVFSSSAWSVVKFQVIKFFSQFWVLSSHRLSDMLTKQERSLSSSSSRRDSDATRTFSR